MLVGYFACGITRVGGGGFKAYFTNTNYMKCTWMFVSSHTLYIDPTFDMHRWSKFSVAVDAFYKGLHSKTF